jgi:Raf kinase inhibitor-like YbhB/YbcL family protein
VVLTRRNLTLFFGLLIFLAAAFFSLKYFFSSAERTKTDKNVIQSQLQLISPAFKEGAAVPEPYTCRGQDVNPPLNILGVPAQAKSLALVVHDPDAVSGDFTHWLVWDMPASTEAIAANSVPVGALQGANGQGNNQYMGPCPPVGSGLHHYQFELYALDKTLGLPAGSDRNQLEKAMGGHIVDHFVLVGTVAAQ